MVIRGESEMSEQSADQGYTTQWALGILFAMQFALHRSNSLCLSLCSTVQCSVQEASKDHDRTTHLKTSIHCLPQVLSEFSDADACCTAAALLR